MVAVIERLAVDFGRFAPELDASPKRCIYRYRDTRFSDDKTPLKTHIAASFRWRGLPKHRSAGLYFEVTPGWVWMGGGFYAPETADLARIRQHISDTHPELDRLTRAPAFRRTFQALEGEQLSRVPRGFAKDDPAGAYLKHRNFLAGARVSRRPSPRARPSIPRYSARSGQSCRRSIPHRASLVGLRVGGNEPRISHGGRTDRVASADGLRGPTLGARLRARGGVGSPGHKRGSLAFVPDSHPAGPAARRRTRP